MLVSSSFRRCHSVSKIRREFIEFFKARDHTHVPSSSVVPDDDERTILFTNAGMNQFKSVFLGDPASNFSHLSKAVSYQKCIRIGGKHNDLEDVGKDVHHQTFFEMLGNWAFRQAYSKREAIEMAWQFLTENCELKPDRLYVSYFAGCGKMGIPPDEETRQIWRTIGLPDSSIIPFKDENFWAMGEFGPCGPCTEIHFDRIGGRNAASFVNCDNSVVELWNLVFMTHIKHLPSSHIDTGMGLERLASAAQGVPSNYETDAFYPLIKAIQKLSPHIPYCSSPRTNAAYRIIADHLRAASIAMADGVYPGNVNAERHVRGLLRRALRSSAQLSIERGALASLVPIIVTSLGQPYPELERASLRIQESIGSEESWYWKVVDAGIAHFNFALARLPTNSRTIPGEVVMRLKSLGVPPDVCAELALSKGYVLDVDEFSKILEEEKQASQDPRFRLKLPIQSDDFPTQVEKFKYSAYEEEIPTKILALFDGSGAKVSELSGNGYAVLEKCKFYVEEGGQASDQGSIVVQTNLGQQEVDVTGGLKINGVSVLAISSSQAISAGEVLAQCIDQDRREALKRAHSATHLLNWALQRTGIGLKQTGSSVKPDRLAFEYAPGECAAEQDSVQVIEFMVNSAVKANCQVVVEEMPLDQAKQLSYLQSEFREVAIWYNFYAQGKNYPGVVRLVKIQSDEVLAAETCCGTHVANTSEIGEFVILTDASMGRGSRRLIAVTGQNVAVVRANAQKWRQNLDALLAKGDVSPVQLEMFARSIPQAELSHRDYKTLKMEIRTIRKNLQKQKKAKKSAYSAV